MATQENTGECQAAAASAVSIVLRSTSFVAAGQDGDFKVMIDDRAYADAFFLYNENVIDAETGDPFQMGCGTPQIRNRSYRAVEDKPQAIGVPTGWSGASGGFGMPVC